MKSQDLKKFKLPDNPGVYFFKHGNNILYIGKATSLKSRVMSYFSSDLIETRGPLILDMVVKADSVYYENTNSVLEALLLEAELIKKYQPYYNTKEKDDRSFNCVVVTKEDYPKVLIVRKKDLDQELLENDHLKYATIFGPFPHSAELKEAMRIVRKIFPFRDKCEPYDELGEDKKKKAKPCFNAQIGLCPGVCVGTISKKEYAQIIKNIKVFFSGKLNQLKIGLNNQMIQHSKKQEFELANKVKKTIFALEHIQDVSFIKKDNLNFKQEKPVRIEAYDIAHLSGKNTVGVMTVVENGEVKKSDYRKFKINSVSVADDTKSLEEMLRRRFSHDEWPVPDIVVFDGGIAQENTIKRVLADFDKDGKIKIVGVVKDDRHKAREILGDKDISNKYNKEIILANYEAHRFAIAYHRKTRKSDFLSI